MKEKGKKEEMRNGGIKQRRQTKEKKKEKKENRGAPR